MATSRPKPPTVRLRRLAFELRRLRDGSGLSREQVEEQTGIDKGTLYRLEDARTRPQRRTLAALLDVYGVEEPHRSELVELARAAADQGWSRASEWQLPGQYAAYVSFEAEARAVHEYETAFVPGLLVTPEYDRAMIQGVLPTATEQQIADRVAARAERQKLLDGADGLDLWAVVDETAVRRVVGGRKVMADQLDHVLVMMRRHNVTFQVIPFDAGSHPGMPGPFLCMEFRDAGDPELVYVDTTAGDMFLESDEDIRRYRGMFDHLRAAALSPARSADLVRSIMKGLSDEAQHR